MRIRLYPFLSLLLIVSCSTQDVCDDNIQAELVARFKTNGTGIISDSVISGVTMYGIREGQPDSLLLDSMTLSRIVLPLDSNSDFSRFILNIFEQTDTLQIDHSNELHFISYACGFATIFTVDSFRYSNLMIKAIEITNEVIDTELELNEEHLWIYF